MPTRPNVCVFAPTLSLSVTFEAPGGDGGLDEIHFHPAGQGFWIARMLHHLGERPVVVTTLGGESGRVLSSLAPDWRVVLSVVEIAKDTPSYVHDRRSGQLLEIARTRLPARDRHEIDELYGRVLQHAASAEACVVTGLVPGESLPLDVYRRLGSDLAAIGVPAIGDLHGEELSAFLEGGHLHTLKVSDVDLQDDGVLAEAGGVAERLEAVERFAQRGAERVVVSSADGATLARFGDRRLRASPPLLHPADPRGSGDAMTAGLAVAALRGLGPERTLAVACAAGAANVTRRGLCSADAALVESLEGHVRVEVLAR